MNCEQANQIDLVDYLRASAFTPQKITNEDHWYFSIKRRETSLILKSVKIKNVWHDHGLGKGGSVNICAGSCLLPPLQLLTGMHQPMPFCQR
jgi:hypothetical protein